MPFIELFLQTTTVCTVQYTFSNFPSFPVSKYSSNFFAILSPIPGLVENKKESHQLLCIISWKVYSDPLNPVTKYIKYVKIGIFIGSHVAYIKLLYKASLGLFYIGVIFF